MHWFVRSTTFEIFLMDMVLKHMFGFRYFAVDY